MSGTDRQKVVLGLSGGVDSSVAALRLREQGYEVHALYLDIGLGGAEAPSTLRLSPAVEGLRPRIRWRGGWTGCKTAFASAPLSARSATLRAAPVVGVDFPVWS